MTQSTGNGTGHPGDAPEATLISVILDRSGSMASMLEPTIKGFNEFMREQRQQKDGGRALMSLTQFDDRYEVNFVGEPVENVPDLDTESYVPRGMTALYDAIGRTLNEVEAWTREHDWNERVLVLIVTDGQENASQEYSFQAVRTLIEQKEKDGWNFAYMGANQDSYAVGDSLSIRQSFSANYDSTPQGTAANYKRMSDATLKYRALKMKGAAVPNFFNDAVPPNQTDPPTGTLTPKRVSPAMTGDGTPAQKRSIAERLKGWLSRRRDKSPSGSTKPSGDSSR